MSETNKKFVTYEEFGARGDGFTDDFLAIYKAHEYANEHKLPVVTDDGKTYYIRDTLIDGEARAAVIKTDVNWGTSKFIIDDTDLDFFDGTRRARMDIFHILSDYPVETVTDEKVLSALSGIGEGTTKLSLALSYPAMLIIYNKNHKVFRRYGEGNANGVDQQELIVIDGEGNVDPSTPFMFNYETVTRVDIYRTDIKPITIKGGIFTTRASRVNIYDEKTGRGKTACYFERGLYINRSHTTLDGVEHYVTGEITTYEHRDNMRGPHYVGFYRATHADGITIKNCVLTGRRYYYVCGTYEFNGNMVNKICLVNCKQSNFWVKDEEGNTVLSMTYSPISGVMRYWGVGGTNFCKNMEYYGCTLSRYDAHEGLYNGKVVDSTLNFMELTGKGELLFENVTWNGPDKYGANSLAFLRPDYGSTWEGTITFKNCTANVSAQGNFNMVYHNFINWNFGYKCYFPNIVIDNLTVNGLSEGAEVHFLAESYSVGKEPDLHLPKTANIPAKREGVDNDMTNDNPIAPPKFIKIINNKQGYKCYIPKCDFFASTEKVGLTETE